MVKDPNRAFKMFNKRLDAFRADEQEKILSLAAILSVKDGYTKLRAMEEAIEKAELWFHDKEK